MSYKNGQQAFLFNNQGSGQVYYPDGRLAVVVALSNTANGVKYQRYFYDSDKKHTLICSIDEHGIGFAMDNSGREDGLKYVSTKIGGLVSSNRGYIISQWKHDRKAQDAGELPSFPLTISLNECLQFVYNDKMKMVVFQCEGLRKEFDCSNQLRRSTSYLENCRMLPGGKLVPKMTFKTLQERQTEMQDKLAHLRNLNKPSSLNIKHNIDVKNVIGALERHFSPFEEKIKLSDYPCTHMQHGWKESAHEQTMLEIPRIMETGTETGKAPGRVELGCGVPREVLLDKDSELKLSGPIPDTWPSELDVRMKLRETNPILRRSFMLRSASGRYSTSLPVKIDLQAMKKMHTLTPTTFDDAINGGGEKLIVVVCLREDDLLCVRARQLFEMVHASNVENNTGGHKLDRRNDSSEEARTNRLPPCEIYQFAMTHSRYLTDKYGVHTLPAYLIFHQGRLVRASIMGGKSVNLRREKYPPRILIFEPTRFKSQIQMEKLLKKLKYESELAISLQDAQAHIKYRAGITSANAVTFYGLVFLDSEIPPTEAQAIASMARKASASAERGCVLVVSLLPMGSIPKSNLLEGVVNSPSKQNLIEGICDYAVTRPLKSTAMDKLERLFAIHQQKMRGLEAAEPQENHSHYGFKKEDIIRDINKASVDAKSGNCLEKTFKLGMKLPVNRAVFRGVKLEKA